MEDVFVYASLGAVFQRRKRLVAKGVQVFACACSGAWEQEAEE